MTTLPTQIENATPVRLTLLAGLGQFPFLVARGARQAGCKVCILALRDIAEPSLAEFADEFHWVPIARVGRWIKLSRRFGANELILAGGVRKREAFSMCSLWRIWRYLPDWQTIRIWYGRARHDRRNLAILTAVADELQEAGITVQNSIKYCPDALADEGVMTKRPPSTAAQSDIDFAWPIAMKIAAMDIGQALAVREKDIISVEGIEGTDAMIDRTGALIKGGWTLVKVAQAHQDMRFDVPTVGPGTIEKLHAARGVAMVIEAGKTLMIEKAKLLELADRYGIVVVGRRSES